MKEIELKETVIYNVGNLPDEIIVKNQKVKLKSLQGGIVIEEEKDVIYVKKTK